MASVESSTTEQLRQAILDDGFCLLADPNIGKRVNQIAATGFPFKTEEGLAFLKLSTFDDKAKSIFGWSGFGFCKALGDPRCAYSFLNNTQTEIQALVIQLWDRGSKVAYYKGSHLQRLAAKPAKNGFLEIPSRNLEIDGVERIEVDMEEGGLAVIDARLGFNVIQGLVINLGFATEEELKEWAPMKVPNIQNIENLLNAMTSEKIGLNFALVTP